MSGASVKPSPPRPSGKTALTTLSGVSIGVQPDDYGLMPGAKRVKVRVPAQIRRAWTRMPKENERETVPVEPYGDDSETIQGEISEAFETHKE